MNIFNQTGRYFTLLLKVFSRPERHSLYVRQTFNEIDNLGVKSIGIVAVISIFMGGITTLQVAYNMNNPLLPVYLIGLGNRDTLILEFSSTIMALIMAGKIGSNITSEIGSMKVTEQIDSLEIMGVNSASYLILPKIIAVVLMFPILYIFSVFFGLIGGLIVGPAVGAVTVTDYLNGIQYLFNPYYVTFSLIKSLVFGFLIASIAAFFGYTVEGGAF
ncbi:MAG: ABC transporter permease, partial [Prolixibacteraceae bacterium]|nr:ABC transporter permease [Prolixibacteraceae bacterium]